MGTELEAQSVGWNALLGQTLSLSLRIDETDTFEVALILGNGNGLIGRSRESAEEAMLTMVRWVSEMGLCE